MEPRDLGKSCYPKAIFFPDFPSILVCGSVICGGEFLGEAGIFWSGEALNSGQCVVRFTSIFKFLSTATSHPVLQGM